VCHLLAKAPSGEDFVNTYCPSWLFEKTWESIPEPAPTVLIEEELDYWAKQRSPWQIAGSILERAAAEIRRLRKKLTLPQCDFDKSLPDTMKIKALERANAMLTDANKHLSDLLSQEKGA
jgi:hypothetical protein